MIQRLFAAHDLRLLDELATGSIAQFLGHVAALQLLTMGAPKALPEGPRQAGIGQRRGCPTALIHRGRLHPAAGSHLPPEDTAPSFAVAPFPRRCALPCTPKTAHSTLSNCRI
ncbi:MAG TPA: hypothetical protein VL380_10040 [Nitrosospira sp.]|nr:hypothetical protein [Nitrosospira sp.]